MTPNMRYVLKRFAVGVLVGTLLWGGYAIFTMDAVPTTAVRLLPYWASDNHNNLVVEIYHGWDILGLGIFAAFLGIVRIRESDLADFIGSGIAGTFIFFLFGPQIYPEYGALALCAVGAIVAGFITKPALGIMFGFTIALWISFFFGTPIGLIALFLTPISVSSFRGMREDTAYLWHLLFR